MKTKDIVVNCDSVLYLEKMGKLSKELQHNGTFVKTSLPFRTLSGYRKLTFWALFMGSSKLVVDNVS